MIDYTLPIRVQLDGNFYYEKFKHAIVHGRQVFCQIPKFVDNSELRAIGRTSILNRLSCDCQIERNEDVHIITPYIKQAYTASVVYTLDEFMKSYFNNDNWYDYILMIDGYERNDTQFTKLIDFCASRGIPAIGFIV